METKLFAFWKYDRFPYVLGGTITKFCEKDYPGRDYVETKEFGAGYFFKPFLIVPEVYGKQLKAEIEEFGQQYLDEKERLYQQYVATLHREWPKLKAAFPPL